MVNSKTFTAQIATASITNTTFLKEKNSFFRDELIQYKYHIKKAKHFFKHGELIEAYHYYSIAKNISISIMWHEAEAHCLMVIGSINIIWKKFDMAYKNYMSCLNLILDKELNNSLSLIYFRLSDYYKKTNQNKLSKTYSEKAISSIKKTTFLE